MFWQYMYITTGFPNCSPFFVFIDSLVTQFLNITVKLNKHREIGLKIRKYLHRCDFKRKKVINLTFKMFLNIYVQQFCYYLHASKLNITSINKKYNRAKWYLYFDILFLIHYVNHIAYQISTNLIYIYRLHYVSQDRGSMERKTSYI